MKSALQFLLTKGTEHQQLFLVNGDYLWDCECFEIFFLLLAYLQVLTFFSTSIIYCFLLRIRKQ